MCASSNDSYRTINSFKNFVITGEVKETIEFKNMIFALKENNITPCYYNEQLKITYL